MDKHIFEEFSEKKKKEFMDKRSSSPVAIKLVETNDHIMQKKESDLIYLQL